MCGRARCTVRADDIPSACHITNGFTSTHQMDHLMQVRSPYVKKHCDSGRPLVFAALYDSWVNSEVVSSVKFGGDNSGLKLDNFSKIRKKFWCLAAASSALLSREILYTFTILTTSCSLALHWLHGRMPVILGNKSLIDAWLNDTSSSNFNTVLKPYEDSELAWHPVTPAMGKPSFDGLECIIEKVDSEQKSTSQIVSSSKESVDEDLEVLEGKTSSTDFEEPNESSDAGISLINHNEAELCGSK
ncbi:hypothetical protein IFM89_029726 [Coptis chinensis]|uniref:Embryonic stem cell-specific 5-hydroxymethylcytosine-binding protein n=1 Tax=Coptis chinensis TaxID=261450 RepID=A0A835LWW4_9MAGN|nr:hypothetical protein IFM89_029726 [Coptis chinensis]